MAGEWETVVPAKAADEGWETVSPAKKQDQGFLHDAKVAATRFALGVAKPPAALAEMAGWTAPAKEITAWDKRLKEESGLGASAASFAGDVAGMFLPAKGLSMGAEALMQVPKVAEAVPAILEAVPTWLKGNIGKSAAVGAGTGLLEPVGQLGEDETLAGEKAKQAGMGAVLGPAASLVGSGAAKVLSPQLQRLKDLAAQGIDVDKFMKQSTLGQTLGGAAQSVENALRSFPFSGIKPLEQKGMANLEDIAAQKAAIRAQAATMSERENKQLLDSLADQEKKALATTHGTELDTLTAAQQAEKDALAAQHGDFSTPIISRALEPLGEKLTPGVKGNAAIDEAASKVSDAYENAIKSMGNVPFSKKVRDDLGKVVDRVTLNPELKADFEREVQNLSGLLEGKKRSITAREWHNQFQRIGNDAYNYSISGSADERAYGRALKELKNSWMDLVEAAPGSEKFKAANAAHSALQAPMTAAGYLKAVADQGGQFDPKQLLSAIRAESSKKRFSRGTDELQQEAVAAYKKMADERAAMKLQHDAAIEAKKAQHGLEKETLAQKHAAYAPSLKNQAELLSYLTGEKAQGAKDIVSKMKGESQSNFLLNRLNYFLGAYPLIQGVLHGVASSGAAPAMGAITGGVGALGPAAALAFGPGALIRGLYGNPKAQEILKDLATKRSPEMLKAAEAIRGHLGTTVPYVGTRLTQPGHDTGEEDTGYAQGGLVYLAGGKSVKKPSPVVESNSPLSIYRADIKGKYKSPDRLETLPTTIDKDVLQNYVKAMRAGEQFGVPQLTPQQIAKMALVEGRGDLGFNEFNYNNPRALKASEALISYGHGGDPANFAAALLDKNELAQRKAIPFEHAWNGLGKSKFKQTGADYAKKYEGIDYALESPKNAPLMDTIHEAYQYETPKPAPGPLESMDPMGSYLPKFADGGAVGIVSPAMGQNPDGSWNYGTAMPIQNAAPPGAFGSNDRSPAMLGGLSGALAGQNPTAPTTPSAYTPMPATYAEYLSQQQQQDQQNAANGIATARPTVVDPWAGTVDANGTWSPVKDIAASYAAFAAQQNAANAPRPAAPTGGIVQETLKSPLPQTTAPVAAAPAPAQNVLHTPQFQHYTSGISSPGLNQSAMSPGLAQQPVSPGLTRPMNPRVPNMQRPQMGAAQSPVSAGSQRAGFGGLTALRSRSYFR